MAVGDRIPTELCLTTLSATATAVLTNSGVSYRTQILEVWLCNTGASTRVISLFKNGLVTANQIANSITLTAGASIQIPMHLVCTGTQTFGAKQDVGTDVNVICNGVVEQIA